MSTEFILVTFPELRDVLTDGNVVGKTNRTLLLPADEYMVSLSGTGYSPSEQDIVLAGTSMHKPKVVAFTVTVAAVAPMAMAKVRAEAKTPQAKSPQAKAPQAKETAPTPKPKTNMKAPAKVKTATKKKAGLSPAPGRRTKNI